ncbi:hypothetical protein GCM10023107_18730 [Actinoplanes octamycinicus]|uniref:GNAT family N-acetyltransferase n=1 Tax=Actinoplanes octamycinicus TaxID=135948 RepID=UPI0031E71B2D
MQIRQISAAERTATMFPLQAYAWLPSPTTSADEEAKHRANAPFFETTTMLVAEADGDTLACAASLPMRQNVRGRVLEMAGIASVTSRPEARRQGVIRQLLERLLRQVREEGAAVSALYPFRPSFYARFGYVGIPRVRVARFTPASLGDLLRRDLPGRCGGGPARRRSTTMTPWSTACWASGTGSPSSTRSAPGCSARSRSGSRWPGPAARWSAACGTGSTSTAVT